MLTAQAAVAQQRAKQESELTDAEWILRNGPARFSWMNNGMVHNNGGTYMRHCDHEQVVDHLKAMVRALGGAAEKQQAAALPALPEPYEEVFIWWDSNSGMQRRVARLDADKKYYQLSTYNCETKSQYLAPVSEVLRWAPIVEGGAV
jgi:hypothetical protein